MTPTTNKTEDRELFDNSFHKWIEIHGVKIHGDGYDRTFNANIDLNVLKLAIIELIDEEK